MYLNKLKNTLNKNAVLTLSALLTLSLTSCKDDDPIETSAKLSKQDVGKLIFFDQNLSNPAGQSCGTCHAGGFAFTDPLHSIVSPGIVDGLFGDRNAPSVSYAQFSPLFHYDNNEGLYIGGQFWDGRAATLEEQATKPFFNPLEMNNTDVDMLATKIRTAAYYNDFVNIYGNISDNNELLNKIADAIATFERSDEVSPFTSKFDYYKKGEAILTPMEEKGMALFMDTLKGKCALCHLIEPDPISGKILFTDFTYDNIGIPKNKFNPFYKIPSKHNPAGAGYIDLGLGKTTKSSDNDGQFKVPTLRNIAVTAPYFHNGAFASLEEAVHFYNARDVEPFPAPEIKETVNKDELGDLKLTEDEEQAIVAFLKTLTDGYK
jgi:cytochrome c peroxidase